MMRYYVVSILTTALFLAPAMTQAAGMPGPIVTCTGAGGSIPCTCEHLIQTAQNVLNTGIYLAVFLSAVLFAWAGWKMMTGKTTGNESSIGDARKILWNVMLGLVIILAAWLIVNTLFSVLTKAGGLGNLCKFI